MLEIEKAAEGMRREEVSAAVVASLRVKGVKPAKPKVATQGNEITTLGVTRSSDDAKLPEAVSSIIPTPKYEDE